MVTEECMFQESEMWRKYKRENTLTILKEQKVFKKHLQKFHSYQSQVNPKIQQLFVH